MYEAFVMYEYILKIKKACSATSVIDMERYSAFYNYLSLLLTSAYVNSSV